MSICDSGAALLSVPTCLRVILAYQVIRAGPGTLRDTINLQKAYSWQPTPACPHMERLPGNASQLFHRAMLCRSQHMYQEGL